MKTSTNYERASMADAGGGGPADAPGDWVREVLEADKLTAAKIHYGRAKLGGWTLALLWALRVYVVFMVLIIALAVWNSLHAAG